jgi:Wings apart-like protein regulation of heterochromatin
MATLFSSHRRKVTTYGRPSRKPSFDPFPDDASPPKKTYSVAQRTEDAPPVRKIFNIAQRTEVRKEATPEQNPSRKATGKLVRPSPKKPAVDPFDVPSSDNESDPFKFTTTKPSRGTKPHTKPALKPAPTKPEKTQKPGAGSKNGTALVDDTALKRKRDTTEREVVDRRQRAKTPRTETSAPPTKVLKEVAIPSPEKARRQSPRPNAQSQVKRARNNKTVRKSPPEAIKKGVSAPAALKCMVSQSATPTDTPMLDAPMSEEQMLSDDVADFLPSTPPLAPLPSPGSISRSGTVTPRQKDLWKKLLDSSDPLESPGSLPISKLNLSTGRAARRMASLSRSVSDIPRTQRSRLVDTLKRSAPISEESDSESEDEIPELNLSSELVIRSPPKLHRTESSEQSSQEAKTVSKTSKVTYGQARSYLEEQNEDAAFDLIAEEFSQPTGFNASQSQHKFDEELSDEDDSQSRQPRTVHDLRAAGARRRLFDDLNSLVDDVSGQGYNSIGVKRTAIIELATKLFAKDAALCILDHGLERKLLENCNLIDDTVFAVASAVAFALVANGGAQLNTLQHVFDSQCFKHILALLNVDHDISRVIKERKKNMSKMAQSSVLDFKKVALASDLWPMPPTSLSPQLVALTALENVIRRMREAGNKEVLLDEAIISTLLSILEKNLPVSDAESAAVIPSLVLSILESSSIFDPAYRKHAGWPKTHLKKLAEMIPTLFLQSQPGTEEFQPLALRLCINVTNKNPRACDAFAQTTVIQTILQAINDRFNHLESGAQGEDRLITMDRLILSHGALLNLAEFSTNARLATITDNNEHNLLKTSVRHFIYGQERAQEADSLQAAEMNIPYGWLAVLLGNLCLAYEVREKVRAEMPGQSLKSLIAAVDEFSRIWQRMNMTEFEGEEGQQTVSELADRMNAVVDRLREIEG